MKLKKALSGILAAAMIVSLTPAMAFASTTNVVSGVSTVAKNTPFTRVLELEVTSDPANWAETQEVTLKLDNAKWYDASTGDSSSKLSSEYLTPTAAAIKVSVNGKTATAFVPKYNSANSVIFTKEELKAANGGTALAKKDIISLTLSLKSTTTGGDITVSISSESGDISASTINISSTVKGDTVANVPDYGTDDLETLVVRKNGQNASDIQIKESSSGVVGTAEQKITLTLPKEFSWNDTETVVAGSLVSGAAIKTITDVDGRVLEIRFTPGASSSARRTMTISPVINASKDAKNGEVSVTLRGISGQISDASGLVIGTIGEAEVSVYIDEDDYSEGEIPSLYSGINADIADEDNVVIITVEEKDLGDLTPTKFIDFEFDENVQLLGDVKVSINGATKTRTGVGLTTDSQRNPDKNRSSFGWEVTGLRSDPGDDPNKIKLYIPVTVEAGTTGDIKCTVTGSAAGVEETVLTVATVKPVLSVTSDVSEVRTGIQNQKINDIVLTESEIGALDDSVAGTDDVVVKLPFVLSKDATITVTGGDLEIGNKVADKGSSVIKFNVKASSVKEASVITISDLEVTLDRVAAEGGYDVAVYGDAVVDNGEYNDGDFADNYKAKDCIQIITPADSTTVSEKVQAAFVIGEASYTNNGTATEMDAAAYIDSHNRTMVPIRYVANACGISENDIRWEQNTQTAIINGLNTVVTVKMGSNKLQTSTGEITMDTVAVNNNGRIYVPVRYIANALGANVSWDAATKTVTLTK